jgi:hypothetical protein
MMMEGAGVCATTTSCWWAARRSTNSSPTPTAATPRGGRDGKSFMAKRQGSAFAKKAG